MRTRGPRCSRYFLGLGASPTRGGTLAAAGGLGNEAVVSFEAKIDPSAAGTEIANVAQATFLAPTLGKELTAISPPARIAVDPSARTALTPPLPTTARGRRRRSTAGVPP